jgi:UDP-3-O-[3-hydroxymyristoyl] glucosamine N-acyltransferase
MEFTAAQIAEMIHAKLEGDPNQKVNNLAKIDQGFEGALSFLYSADYKEHLNTTLANVVIISNSIQLDTIPSNVTLLWVDDARMAFAGILEAYHNARKQAKMGVHPNAVIAETAKIGEQVYIASNVTIGENTVIGNGTRLYSNVSIGDNVKIGSHCEIYSNATVYDDSEIGNHCTLQSGCVIGSEGFGFQPNAENNYRKIIHIGNVVLEDHVEIGANTCIDRATMGSTLIRKGVKLDNLIQVAHNVEIGENTVVASQTGIAGSVVIGKNCMIGGQVGFAGHQKIADGTKIAAQSGIAGDLENGIYQGSPAIAIRDYKKSYVLFKNLPSISQKLVDIEKTIFEIKNKLS